MRTKFMRCFRRLPFFLLALTLPYSSRAAVIACDGADYAATDSISGLAGGTGWNGGWSGVNNLVAGSLQRNGVATNGNRPIPASGYLFRIGKDGSNFEVLHAFLPAVPNGRFPVGGFLKGRDGALYGTTVAGGANGAGVLFKLARASSQPNPPVTLIPSVVAGGNSFQLSFTGVPLGQYEIQSSGQLPPDWQFVNTVQADGVGHVEYLENLPAGTASRFFRVLNH